MSELRDNEKIELGILIGTTKDRDLIAALKNPFVTKKGSFVKIVHEEESENNFVTVLAKVQSIIRTSNIYSEEFPTEFLTRAISSLPQNYQENIIGILEIIGFFDSESNRLKLPRRPLRPGSKIYSVSSEDLLNFFQNQEEDSIYIGRLIGYEKFENRIPINLSINNLISEHFAILAMTGSGKSYTVGRICEKIVAESNGTVIILDPHGEYGNSFKKGIIHYDEKKIDDEEYNKERELLHEKFEDLHQNKAGICVISPDNTESTLKYGTENFIPLILNLDDILLTDIELILPEMTEPQRRVFNLVWEDWLKEEVYPRNPNTLIDRLTKNFEKFRQTLDSTTGSLGISSKSAAIAGVRLKSLLESFQIFYVPNKTKNAVSFGDVIGYNPPRDKSQQFGKLIIIDFQSLPKEILQIASSIILTQILRLSKSRKIRPVLIIAEEGHTFAPATQNITSKGIITQIAAEGRKFGLGLGIVSQRPSKLDSDVISQCNTFFILRIKNPEDQSFVRKVAEYISASDLDDLPALNIGEALIFGKAIFHPLIVKVGPRHLKHGGETPNLLSLWRERFYEPK